MKKVGIISLGCPKNTVDTENLLGDLAQNGYEITSDQDEADVLIVNTCGFIEAATRESIDAILDAAKIKSRGADRKLVVTGCLAERYDKQLLEEIPEIDLLLGTKQYPGLKDLLAENGSAPAQEKNHVGGPARYFDASTPRMQTTPFYTTYLKIAEGCSNRCSFCIIPKMRGPFHSFPLDDVLQDARNLAATGARELNIISQDTTMYGVDLRMKNGLVHLLREMAKTPGVEWMRLLYCYPTFIDRALMDCIAAEEKVCNYVDVPLQHTHDFMLARMKREERETGVRKMLADLRNRIPGVALRTTFIVGFPGETEEHFQHMARFIQEEEFDHIGVFTYSHEEGTTAYQLEDVPAPEVAQARKEEIMSIQREISARKNAAKVGKTLRVLVEGLDEEGILVTGRLETQAPDIDGQVIIEESDVQPGEMIEVKITAATDYDLVGRKV